ncbi:hypothetical protein [Nitrosopumilus piranensis]|uniref:Uncharacterized protein n=1 Tax=Nitrosopumilus piranensis TaxID=1582439 RepID=A0A0C5BVV4_9ARCH|nr:hypothetical protein [Nitrosopumilus piranensis]AJM92401.1 hypothetical protein NPIRD3C_1189 [Nitrosopumilus piranensis]
MDKLEKLLNMLMDFNDDIRFAAVSNDKGEILWWSQREGLKNLVPFEETKQTLLRALHAWDENARVKDFIGNGLYSISSYQKIKRITVPLGSGKMLFCTLSNKPLKKSLISGKKSYGHLADMGKILSIVDFIKSQK